MSKRSDEQLIEEALTHLGILRERLSRGDLADQIVADAVSMRLAAAIDALHHGEPLLGERLFLSDWRKIWGTRNYLAHGYAIVDIQMIAETVQNDLPEFERVLREELGRSRR